MFRDCNKHRTRNVDCPTPQELHIDLATIATEVTFLQSLTRLRKLGLTGCYKVTSLEPMAALTSLSALDISDSRCRACVHSVFSIIISNNFPQIAIFQLVNQIVAFNCRNAIGTAFVVTICRS
jgi:hypothetical protein